MIKIRVIWEPYQEASCIQGFQASQAPTEL